MPVKTQLGSMVQLTDVRTVWPNEASDFTPWLAKHMELLNDATGLSLETVEQESAVGTFSLDILAQDSDSGALAVIENQLEDTDHDHLGKLLTYAAGKDAKYIIWVVRSAREEHRAAVEWLNNSTVDGIGFFLVEIQLWQIDGSLPAPRLNVEERPNDWAKLAKRPAGSQGGAAVQFKYEYWTAFNDYAFKNGVFSGAFRRRKASSDHWYSMSIGVSGTHITLLVNTKADVIAVELSISDDKELYDRFFTHRGQIEAVVGEKLDWRRLDGKKASRILLEKRHAGLKNRDGWKDQFTWYMETAVDFKRAFSPYLSEK